MKIKPIFIEPAKQNFIDHLVTKFELENQRMIISEVDPYPSRLFIANYFSLLLAHFNTFIEAKTPLILNINLHYADIASIFSKDGEDFVFIKLKPSEMTTPPVDIVREAIFNDDFLEWFRETKKMKFTDRETIHALTCLKLMYIFEYLHEQFCKEPDYKELEQMRDAMIDALRKRADVISNIQKH